LTYEKLHKLVYVNYNLRIQNSIDRGSLYHDDNDQFNRLMELTLIDASNPIREWIERARSMAQPELDEESPATDALIPILMVTATADPQDLQHCTGSQSVSQWARKNIGDNHKGKRKTYAMRPKR
jgi:CheY-like chemotaxis protein